jgi:hypothetical protein
MREFGNHFRLGTKNWVGIDGYTRDPARSHAIKRIGKLGWFLRLDDLHVYAKP